MRQINNDNASYISLSQCSLLPIWVVQMAPDKDRPILQNILDLEPIETHDKHHLSYPPAIEHPEKWRFSLLGKSSNYCWVIFQQAMFEDSGGYTLSYGNVDRRKFRSQISTRWKSRGGKSQRRERVSRKKIRERVRRKRMLTHEKVESRETLCFPIVLQLQRIEKQAC